jgi:hypothetical protein
MILALTKVTLTESSHSIFFGTTMTFSKSDFSEARRNSRDFKPRGKNSFRAIQNGPG